MISWRSSRPAATDSNTSSRFRSVTNERSSGSAPSSSSRPWSDGRLWNGETGSEAHPGSPLGSRPCPTACSCPRQEGAQQEPSATEAVSASPIAVFLHGSGVPAEAATHSEPSSLRFPLGARKDGVGQDARCPSPGTCRSFTGSREPVERRDDDAACCSGEGGLGAVAAADGETFDALRNQSLDRLAELNEARPRCRQCRARRAQPVPDSHRDPRGDASLRAGRLRPVRLPPLGGTEDAEQLPYGLA